MGKNTSLFSQILRLFPRSDFQSLVKRTNAEYHSRGVGCWHQFTAMLFGQLSKANSLSEVVNGLKSCEGKLTHLGVKPIGKSTLAYMNMSIAPPGSIGSFSLSFWLKHTQRPS